MNDNRPSSAGRGAMLAVVLSMVLAGASTAETVLIRNESSGPVVVQAAGVVRGVLRRGRPVLLNAMEVSPPIMLPGNKILSVYDAKAPNRVLFQGVITANSQDQFLSIVPDFNPAKMKIETRRTFRER